MGFCCVNFLIILYLIIGVVILLEGHTLWNTCNGTRLWYYILLSLILFFTKHNFKDPINNSNKLYFISGIIIELGLIIWGAVELFINIDNCPILINSDLWIYGIITFNIQIITLLLVCFRNIYSNSIQIYPINV